MKKTIITLMALAGVAAADVLGDWTATFTSDIAGIGQTVANYTASFEPGAPLTLTISDNWTLNNSGDNQANGTYTDNTEGHSTTSIRPNANVGNGATYTLNFTLTNSSQEDVKLDAITLNVFLYNSGGALQGGDAPRVVSFVMSGDVTGTANEVIKQENSKLPITLTLNDETALLKSGESVDFSLQVSRGTSDDKEHLKGTFVGLSGATFKVVPEPATATLSLLALAGLAMRRRRK